MPRTHVWWRTKGPKTTAKETITKGKVRIKQVRSGIGHSWRMRLTLEALGLRHHQAGLTRLARTDQARASSRRSDAGRGLTSGKQDNIQDSRQRSDW
jgi:hypothetical protein